MTANTLTHRVPKLAQLAHRKTPERRSEPSVVNRLPDAGLRRLFLFTTSENPNAQLSIFIGDRKDDGHIPKQDVVKLLDYAAQKNPGIKLKDIVLLAHADVSMINEKTLNIGWAFVAKSKAMQHQAFCQCAPAKLEDAVYGKIQVMLAQEITAKQPHGAWDCCLSMLKAALKFDSSPTVITHNGKERNIGLV